MTSSLHPAESRYYGMAIRLAEMLGRRFGVNIVFGHHPATDGDTVFLPHWDLEDPLARRVLIGCIAHEAGGHVRQSDFARRKAWIETFPQNRQALYASVENICEDIRIENNLFGEYPGARHYIDAAIERLVASGSDDAPERPAYWPSVQNWLLARMRSNLLRQAGMLRDAAVWEKVLRPMVGDDVLEKADRLGRPLLAIGPAKEGHQSVMSIAEDLIDLFETARPSLRQPDPPPSQEESGSKPGDQDGAAEGPSAAGTPEADGPGASEPPTKGAGGRKETPGTSSGASEPAAVGVDVSLPTEVGGDVIGAVLARNTRPVSPDMRSVSYIGGGASLGAAAGDRAPVLSELARARSLAHQLVPALAPLLVGELYQDDRRPRGRTIDARRLSRTRTHDQAPVFIRRMIEEDASVALHILVDRSSSTRGAIYEDITVSTLGLAVALERFDQVETVISHFPVAPGLQGKTGIDTTKRAETPCHVAARSWPMASGGTPLAPAIESATIAFLASHKMRRILFVITDGKPAAIEDCHRAARFARALDVEIYGIVVGAADYPVDLFDQSEQIGTSAELSGAIRRLVLRLL